MGKLSYNDKVRMQTLLQVSNCLVYTTAEPVRVVDSTADFLASAQLSPFVSVTGDNGFLTKKTLLTKRLHAQFVVARQFSHR